MYHGRVYLVDINTNAVYTNNLSSPEQVGEMLINGDVLLYRNGSSPNATRKGGHHEDDEDRKKDEQNHQEADEPVKIHLHF
jgi:hypothetical protein